MHTIPIVYDIIDTIANLRPTSLVPTTHVVLITYNIMGIVASSRLDYSLEVKAYLCIVIVLIDLAA